MIIKNYKNYTDRNFDSLDLPEKSLFKDTNDPRYGEDFGAKDNEDSDDEAVYDVNGNLISRKKKKKLKKIKKLDKKKAEEMRKIILIRKKILSLILRVNTFGSLEHMTIEIFKWPKMKFKFLNLFFEMIDDIQIMEALPAIIDFT